MTLLEVLVAVLIASSGIALLVPAFVRQLQVSSEPDRLTAVEAVVSRDLDWISDYARWWKMRSGPYNLSPSITTLSGWSTESEATYEPPADHCEANTLSSDFVDAMGSVPASAVRPYAISGSGTTDIASVNGITVQRIISIAPNRLHVSYLLQGDPASSLRFNRQASVLIEAAAWCEKLP